MIRRWLQHYRSRKQVRPWALLGPVVVLLVCLPLLRPLRSADPRYVSDDERSILAATAALVEHRNINETPDDPPAGGDSLRDHLPALALLLSIPYWLMNRWGLSFDSNPQLVMYLLTLLGVTVPAAVCSGLTYRMARLFELRRPWRALLALAVVFASGLIGYATTLNAHAPAAALVLAAAACIVHVAITNRRVHGSVWLITAGICAAAAALIDPAAILFLVLLPLAILTLRWRAWPRIGGVVAYALGAALSIGSYVAIATALTGQSSDQCVRAMMTLADVNSAGASYDPAEEPSSWIRGIL